MKFEDLTLAEIEMIETQVLGGKPLEAPESSNIMVAAGIMWVSKRRAETELTFPDFKARTTMGDIKSFAIDLEHAEMDPT